ncbi:MAG: cytochrome P450 [Pseudomonadota bacterium]
MALPHYRPDIYSEQGIADPYPHYRAIRDLGPAVRLAAQDIVALGRYADVRAALMDHGTFRSGAGVAVNDQINGVSQRTTLASDPPLHQQLRAIIAEPLQPRAVALLREAIDDAAEHLIARLAAAGRFDGVADLARFLPVSIISNLVGLPEEGRDNMLDWAAATFDCLGPANARMAAAMPCFLEMLGYVLQQAGPAQVKPGSWAEHIYAAAREGRIAADQAPALMLDYLGPSLDTTIFATAHMLHLFARNPDQWALVLEDEALIPAAVNEVVRFESPIRGFTRLTTRAVDVGGVTVAAGQRVLLLYASANRDGRMWDAPDRFDILRPNLKSHLGFGLGRHVCAGQHLARLEIQALLRAMRRHFTRFEIGEPTIQVNNVLRGFASLPVTLAA